jgi:aspartyl/asparaginyl beta-hydroxylase (cupin superfamily)
MIIEKLKAARRKLILEVGAKLLWKFERTMETYSRVGQAPVFALERFPWVPALARESPSIRRELDALLEHREKLPNFQDISPDQRVITEDDGWKTFFLYGFGTRSEPNCARCPCTARALERVPGLVTAFFSILAPGKHIPDHRGVYKGLVRAHLGLKVPEPGDRCRMEIEGSTLHWREGEVLVFDDTFRHEVWNDTDGERVVLLLDVLRPLPVPLALLNRALVRAVAATPYVTDGVRNERAWEKQFARALGEPAS